MEEPITKDKVKLITIDCKKEERVESDKKYAIKLVERIVFGIVTAILLAFLAGVIGLVIKK